ncbi:MAG: hypothetical protein ACLS4Z_10380 [Christensenellaceae bacterium]
MKEVEPLVGKTVYAYPYGEWILGENCSDPRQRALIEAGFRLSAESGKSLLVKMPLGESSTKVLFRIAAPSTASP